LGDFEEDLESVVFSVLDVVEAEVELGEFLEIFDGEELSDSTDVVVAEEQKLEPVDGLEANQLLYLVLGQIESSK